MRSGKSPKRVGLMGPRGLQQLASALPLLFETGMRRQ